jgi:hypothetical protein
MVLSEMWGKIADDDDDCQLNEIETQWIEFKLLCNIDRYSVALLLLLLQ